MSNRFDGKTVLITGGASGLGLSSALQMAMEGANLALVDLSMAALEAARSTILASCPDVRVLLVAADVSDEDAVKSFVQRTVQEYGVIHGFFNNAGIEGKQNVTADYESEMFHKVIDVNLNGVFYGMKHVLQVMKNQGHGSIVNTASVGGMRGIGNQSGYAASKAGVIGMTRNSGVEYGQYGISIKAIAPGAIMTPMVEGSLKQIDPEGWEAVGKQFVSLNPMKRFGKPEEVAYLVAFLLSSQADFINAVVIPIDGGQSYKY